MLAAETLTPTLSQRERGSEGATVSKRVLQETTLVARRFWLHASLPCELTGQDTSASPVAGLHPNTTPPVPSNPTPLPLGEGGLVPPQTQPLSLWERVAEGRVRAPQQPCPFPLFAPCLQRKPSPQPSPRGRGGQRALYRRGCYRRPHWPPNGSGCTRPCPFTTGSGKMTECAPDWKGFSTIRDPGSGPRGSAWWPTPPR